MVKEKKNNREISLYLTEYHLISIKNFIIRRNHDRKKD